MTRMFIGLLIWVGFSLAAGVVSTESGERQAYFLLYPILWIIGLIMWISFGVADLMEAGPFGTKER